MGRTALGLAFVFATGVGVLVGLVAGGGGIVHRVPAPAGVSASAAWPAFPQVFERVNPAVVHIAVAENDAEVHTELGQLPGWGTPRHGEGSGFVIDPDGYVVTN